MVAPTVEVTAKAPSIAELEQAMIAAHNAGDTNSAAILANEIQKLQSASSFKFSGLQAAKNFLPDVYNEAKNVVGAITQPIETAKGLGNLSLGLVEKLLPNVQNHEKYANALGDYFANKYGSKDAFLQTLQEHPASVLSDASMFLTGGATGAAKVASLAKAGKATSFLEKAAQVGTAVDPINALLNTGMYGATKVIPTTLAPKMYESAAKWSTKLTPEERAGITQTALQNQIPLSYEGLGQVQSKLGVLGDQMDNLISNATNNNIKIPATKVLESLKDVRSSMGGFKIEGAQDITEINNIEKKFRDYLKKEKITSVTPEELQRFKSDAYKKIDFGRSPEKPSIAKEKAYQAMAGTARQSLENIIPELKSVNAQYGSLKELQPNLQKAVGRIENRDLIGIGSGVKAGAGAAVGGNIGAALGLGESILEMPKVKSKAALELYKKQNQGIGMFLDNNARNALLRQILDQQFQLNSQYPSLLGNQ
jgi:hypothetical protein